MVYLMWQKEEQKGVGLLCKLLGKIPSKGKHHIFTRCTENQEYISVIFGKIAIIFHIMEVTFKTSFQFVSRLLLSNLINFVRGIGLDGSFEGINWT